MAFWMPCNNPDHGYRYNKDGEIYLSRPVRVSERTMRYRCRYCKETGVFVEQGTVEDVETRLKHKGLFYRQVPDDRS